MTILSRHKATIALTLNGDHIKCGLLGSKLMR